MTSDLESTTDDLLSTIRNLWLEATGSAGDDVPTGSFGQRIASVSDDRIAEVSGLDLAVVREYLDNAGGVKFALEHAGETRKVTGLY